MYGEHEDGKGIGGIGKMCRDRGDCNGCDCTKGASIMVWVALYVDDI